jgi:hypothetical protein
MRTTHLGGWPLRLGPAPKLIDRSPASTLFAGDVTSSHPLGLRVIESPYLPAGCALVMTQPTPTLVNLADLERELARAPRPTP